MLLDDCHLSQSDLSLLKKGNYHTINDIVLTPIQDIAKRCRTSAAEIKRITDKIFDSVPLPDLPTLSTPGLAQDEIFTTGDDILDEALNGGIRTGMVWEVVGESSAGKTQLALQLSLSVQLPREQGGLEGCVCFLTTSSKLPTARLVQIAQAHERLSPDDCDLSNVHTIAIPTIDILHTILGTVFPAFVAQQASTPGARPVRLLVIDALAELFHSADRTSTSTLVARSKNIVSLSSALHQLAHKHRIAVVVLNEVIERFSRGGGHPVDGELLLYEDQSRWFNTAQYFGDGAKEAALGLVWANQVNTRIMLSRTLRRRYLQPDDFSKRQRTSTTTSTSALGLPEPVGSNLEESQPTLIRRMCVLFSNICQPVALDYIVSEKGITVLDSSEDAAPGPPPPRKQGDDKPLDGKEQARSKSSDKGPVRPIADVEEDADDQLWDQLDPLDGLDWDALEQTLSQAIT